MQTKTSSSLIIQIVRAQSTLTQYLFSMLQPEDIVLLMLLNSDFYHLIQSNKSIQNRIFYKRMLQIERSAYFDFHIEGINSEQHLKEIMELITTDIVNFTPEIEALRLLQGEFISNLKGYITDQDANDHLENFRTWIREPELPMPGLQKQNVGEYCNTPIQMLITCEAIENKIQPFEQQQCDLRKQILQNADEIMSFFANPKNHALLKKLRYNPELIMEYSSCDSHFVNILQLLVLKLTVHVNSIRKLLQSLSGLWKPNKVFEEFCLRYSIFRNAICGLEDKYGFMFKHFNEAFCQQFQDYPSIPTFSLWRTSLKIWGNIMSELHIANKKIFSQLMLFEIGEVTRCVIEQYIANPESPNQSSAECEYRKSNSFECQNIEDIGIQKCGYLYSMYQEYLIDISANQFNIHWCGSTQQRLHGPYEEAESELLLSIDKYCKYIESTFSSPFLIKKITTQAMEILQERLKPATHVKVQNQIIQCQKNVKEKILLGTDQVFKDTVNLWKNNKLNTSKQDGWIKYLAEQRGLKQESGEKYKMYFDTNFHVDLSQMQKQIMNFKKETEDAVNSCQEISIHPDMSS